MTDKELIAGLRTSDGTYNQYALEAADRIEALLKECEINRTEDGVEMVEGMRMYHYVPGRGIVAGIASLNHYFADRAKCVMAAMAILDAERERIQKGGDA